MLRTKRFLTVLLAVVMILQTIAMPTFALDTNLNVSTKTKQTIAKFTDFPKSSWSTEALTAAVENGLLVGTSETKIEPRKNLTRAEFAAIITRAFGATQKADISNFKDLKAGAWYVDSVAKAVQMGVMNGTGATTFAPNAYMKREDVILALARVLFVDGKDASVLSQFSDRDKIDTWSVAAIAGMVKEGYVHGYEDGTIRPQNLITREELAQLFHNIFKTYISAQGTVTSVAKTGSVIVRSKDVTLKDVTIYGDLVMADGIGDGDFRLENVAVTGKILARGGEGTCYFVRVASDGLVIINDPNGVVNFHNYRDDVPFHNNLLENTPATFLERKKEEDKKPSSTGGTTGGTTKKYSLTFYDFDGNPIDDGVIGVKNEKGTYKVRDFDVPTNDYMYKENYEFVGWTDGVETKTRSYFISKNLSSVDGKWYPVYVPVTVTPDEYTITFVTPSGDVPVTKTEGEALDASDIPSVTPPAGFTFEGWSTTENDDEAEFTNDALTAGNVEDVFASTDVTLYPVYKEIPVTYSVAFKYTDDAEALPAVTKELLSADDYVLTASDVYDVAHPTAPADYRFIGWTTTADGTDYATSQSLRTSIKTLESVYYAQFEEITVPETPVRYSVEFKHVDNTEALPTVTKELLSADDYVLTDSDVYDLAKTGYNFLGWTTTVDGTDYISSAALRVSIKNLGTVYYAQFEEILDEYTITFVTPAGDAVINKTEGDIIDTSEIPVITVDESKEFLGWTKTEGSTNVDYTNDELTADVVENVFDSTDIKLYPVIKDKDSYIVIFKPANDGETDKEIKKYDPDYVLTDADVPVDPSKSGFTFEGWSKDENAEDGEERNYFVGKKISEVVGTWYPIFKEIVVTPDKYTITFVTPDGDEVVEKTEGEALEASDIPSVTPPTGFTFEGWATTEGAADVEFTNDDLTAGNVEDVFASTDVTLYPVYKEIPVVPDKYTITFVTPDGDEVVEKTEGEALEASDIPSVTPPAGFTFEGWSTTENDDEAEFTNDALTAGNVEDVFASTDVTLYPVYKEIPVVPDKYTITFVTPDGDEVVEKTEGETIDASEIPEITVDESKKFVGWATTEGAATPEYTNDGLTAAKVETLFDNTSVTLYPVIVDRDAYIVTFKHPDGDVTVTKYDPDYLFVGSDVAPTPSYHHYIEFCGWSQDPDAGFGDFRSDFVGRKISELVGIWYPITYEEKAYVSFEWDFGYDSVHNDYSYIIKDSDVPAAPVVEGYDFLGWAEDIDVTDSNKIYDKNYFIGKMVGDVAGAYYAILEGSFGVEFKFTDDSVALNPISKTLRYHEDYKLTDSDVVDVQHPVSPIDYRFLGWTTTPTGTDYIDTNDLVGMSIKELSPVYYAQFEEITVPETPVTYTVEFKYTDGTEALATVTKELLSSENYILTDSDVYDVDYHTTPEDYEFLGWTTTVDGADYKTSAELRASIKTLSPVYYAQFKHIDDVEYYVEHYFEQLDGSYVLDTTETLYEKPGTFVTATALTTLPDGYEGENTSHADRVAEGTIPALPDTLTLKLYYDLKVITVTYMELGDVALTIDNGTEMIYAVKYGGTIDNFYDPADDTKTNEEIKAEIANFIEYNTAIGYGKDYDDEYLYNEFEAKDTDGDGVADEYDYYNKFGKNQYEHEINFNWYVEDAAEEYVLFDVAHVFTSDLDIHSKVKKLNIVIGFPAKLTDEVLTLNVPYEETTRFLDSVRDALFINENIAEFPEMTGVEDKLYEKLSQVGGKFFDGEGPVNEDRSLNNTDVLIYFYQMMGGKDEYKKWLWNEVEDNLLLDLGDVKAAEYNTLRNSGLNQQQALYKFFEEKVFGETPELAANKYFASKEFIRQSTEEKTFEVNEFNEFIMEKVDEKIRSLATVEDVIDEYIGDKIPEGLLKRLPMEIVEDVYETRVAHFLEELEIARYEASHGHPGLTAHSGIEVDVNLVAELIKPIAEFAVEKHEALINKAKNSSNRGAELFYKYYGENPYASALVGSYGKIDLFFVEKGNDTALADKYGHLNSSFNNLKTYKIETFENIYKNVVMPLSVETIDALLWYMDPEGGAVEFSKIRNLAEDNEDLILALYNHPNKLMAKYAEEGLPEDMIEYYNDLLSDPEIKAAVEKIDNKVDFDMMYFVEEKLQNATLEVYYLKVLDRVGVPVQNILDKYTNSKAYKELTHDDFVFYLDELEKAWETVDGIENYNATTDYVFENVLEKVGNTGDKAQASFKGFEMVITRFFADYIEQPAD